ncbi:mechanosensitive ion channel family protein [Botryobacter ruber]|uniref:mechanosensitive ion channel family protein n=1 Tax=Botryobacter ruber TaxID=2171629 RepID=UPI000E0B275C|nr:mechanosensitive ion channel family protein [Botryobacter ruber]
MNREIREILGYEFLGNTVTNFLIFAGILLLGFILKKVLSKLLSHIMFRLVDRFSQEEGQDENTFKRFLLQPLEVLIMLVVLFFAFQALKYPLNPSIKPDDAIIIKSYEPILKIVRGIYKIFMIVAVTWVILRFVDFIGLIFRRRAEKTQSKLDDQLIPFFKDFAKALISIFAFLVILGSVFGLDVGTFVAGLGVGGLAIAFAAKESLENLLASFTIFLDQPFVVGDLVEAGGITGTIEKIGFRSTRIRTLEKTFVTVPNKSMIDKPLNNLTLRTFRRVNFDINLTYDTTSEQIKAITQDLQEFIDNHPKTNQDGRIRFHNLGAHSKDVMVLYFVDTTDWNEFIDVREEIAFKIIDIVEGHGADFAFPTSTVLLQQVPDRP